MLKQNPNIDNDHYFVKNRCHQLAVPLDSSAVDISAWFSNQISITQGYDMTIYDMITIL